jgi:hypothetical protein
MTPWPLVVAIMAPIGGRLADRFSAAPYFANVRGCSQATALAQYLQAFLYANVRRSPLFTV